MNTILLEDMSTIDGGWWMDFADGFCFGTGVVGIAARSAIAASGVGLVVGNDNILKS